MRFNLASFFSAIFAITLVINLPSQAKSVDANEHLQDKLYRQALYFYFIGKYDDALRQISLNRERVNSNSSRSHLFEAGLQVSVGLHTQATQTLYQLQKIDLEK
eukprot:TRINITY_DN26954_c0_g1_i1.p1 TRINITY_DN26954_c0_g1~~TRINITY_DN26954_c0_g1_i1.p1  ORF type:complete len:104 (-),score=12.98 TRINITY_DN26954_c0_g1_i1:221-532(-)